MRSIIKTEKFINKIVTYDGLPDVYVYKIGCIETPKEPHKIHSNINEALHSQERKFKNARIIFYEPKT